MAGGRPTLTASGAIGADDVAAARRRPQIPALTSLRFVAAIYVVLFHLSPVAAYPFPLDHFIAQGRAGVAFFFILSGFILTYNYADWFRTDLSRSWRFYQARIARVYPMYLVGMLICTPITLYFLSASTTFASRWFEGHVVPGEITLSWLVNLLALQPFVPLQAYQYYWNSPGWSIGAEFFFYALFPLIARHILNRFRTPRALLLMLGMVLLVQVTTWLGLTFWIVNTFHDQAYHDAMDLFVYKPPFMRLPEFLIGCLVGALLLQAWENPQNHPFGKLLRSARWRNGALLLGVLAYVAVVFLPTPPTVVLVLYPMKFFILLTPVFTLLILALACGRTFLHRVLEHRVFVYLGEVSFSVYILHGSVRMILLDTTPDATPLPLWVVLGLVTAIVIAAIAFYEWVEVPAREALRGRLQAQRQRTPQAAFVADVMAQPR